MTISRRLSLIVFLLAAAAARADWRNVAPGVDYQEYRDDNYDIHVARIDLTSDEVRVIASRESEKGTKVSDFARKEHAVIAINGDYFDDKFTPIGMTVGACGQWEDVKQTRREGYLAVGDDRAKIVRQADADMDEQPKDWMDMAVSGWPALIVECEALQAKRLPGSDAFTRAPHPRTAVGLSGDRKTLFFVVADGRRTGIPGLTLAQLARFMRETLHACSAINLDGGGSSAMWVNDRIVNRPADGVERRVGDHLAVVLASDFQPCDEKDEADKVAANRAREAQASANQSMTSASPPR